MLINEIHLQDQIIADRKARGIDGHDEVWEGVYVVSPIANNEHQELVGGLSLVYYLNVTAKGLGKVYPGINLSDRNEDWNHNFRVPDVAVVLNDCQAVNQFTHWVGAISSLVEILSEGDQSYEKLPFYEKLGVGEVLFVLRNPWALELYRHEEGKLRLVGRSTLENAAVLESRVLPLTYQLVVGPMRPLIKITTREGGVSWEV